jgi:chromosome segregation ATPase
MKSVLSLCVVSLACALAWPVQAQDAAASRDREMLRRTQQALREAQAAQEQAQRERSTLITERTALQESLQKEGVQREQLAKQLVAAQRKLEAERRQAKAERDAIEAKRVAAEQQAQQQGARADAAEQQLAQTRQELRVRTQAIERLTLVLDASTKALNQAEGKNRELYAAGMKALEAYRRKGVGDAIAAREPVFGLRAVEHENIAETLRSQIDAERLQTTPATPTPAPTPAAR